MIPLLKALAAVVAVAALTAIGTEIGERLVALAINPPPRRRKRKVKR